MWGITRKFGITDLQSGNLSKGPGPKAAPSRRGRRRSPAHPRGILGAPDAPDDGGGRGSGGGSAAGDAAAAAPAPGRRPRRRREPPGGGRLRLVALPAGPPPCRGGGRRRRGTAGVLPAPFEPPGSAIGR